MRLADETLKALLSLEEVFVGSDDKVKGSYYLEFWRRAEVLNMVLKYCGRNSLIVDIGAAPFITSCALRRLGFNVVAVDIEPEKYMYIARECGINVIKADLERDELPQLGADCSVFSEVIEHLNPYYVPEILRKINKTLAIKGKLILTTPNIASLFRRFKLLIGAQPQYRLHVHEYTKKEVEEMLVGSGFKIIESYYSTINDLTFVDAKEPKQYLTLGDYRKLISHTLINPTKTNILRLTAYPLIKLIPSLRQLIIIIAEKTYEPKSAPIERW